VSGPSRPDPPASGGRGRQVAQRPGRDHVAHAGGKAGLLAFTVAGGCAGPIPAGRSGSPFSIRTGSRNRWPLPRGPHLAIGDTESALRPPGRAHPGV